MLYSGGSEMVRHPLFQSYPTMEQALRAGGESNDQAICRST